MKTTLLRTGTLWSNSKCQESDSFSLRKMKFAVFVMLLASLFFTAHATAQIALRATTTNTTTSTTLTITKPSGLAVNDIMFATITQSNNGSSNMGNASLTGWTFLNGGTFVTSGTNRYHLSVLYKVAVAADLTATNYAFALNANSDDGVGAISAFSGVNVSSPFDVASTAVGGTSNTITATGITTATPNAAVLMFAGIGDDVNVSAWSSTSPGTLTELFDEDFNATADMGVAAAWANKAAAGATGNGTGTLANSENWGAVMVALKPVTIATGTISGAPFCAGNSISVPYTIAGPYNTTNTFTAQLSNASGSFASPVTLGSVANTNTAGTISGTIPGGTASGTGYRVRVVSSLPAATGTDNGVNITINTAATSSAGAAFSACSTATSIAIGTGATANGTVNWTSNGTGAITNPTSLNGATYTPGVGEAATVTFTLTATPASPCTGTATSNKVLTFVAPPTATAGGTATICQNGTHTVVGATSSNGIISWAENGAGSITAGGTTNAPTYTAAAGDAGNNVTLTMTVSNGTCTNATATYTIHVNGTATAVAGTAVVTCENAGAVNITAGSSATNNAGVTWTSSGTGTFNNATSMTLATYDPSPADITTGSVTLTLTAIGNAPCGNATSNKTLTIRKLPTATAGGSATICQNGTHTVVGATASNGIISWSENGAGSITAGGTTTAPTYTAAAGDAGNTVTLTMSVTNSPCAIATATYTINVLGSATAVAGTAVSTCSNAAVNITAGASSLNNSSITWTSNGTGTIANANSLTLATYTPGPAEAGTVTLTLTATGNSPCINAVSTKSLTVLAVPVATGVTICQGQPSAALTSATSCPNTSAISSGAKFAGTGANSGTGTAWTTPTNISSDNNAYAVFTGTVGFSTLNATSQVLTATNFGFAIPANAIIDGIQATIGRSRSGAAVSGEVSDNNVRIVKGGAATGTNKAISGSWSTAETAASYGTASDLWGTTWTAADINASNFGLSLVADLNVAIGTRNGNVDYITISVTYRLPGELNWYTVSSGGSSIATGSSFNPVGVAGSGLTDTNTAATTTYYVECSSVAGCRTPVNFVINPLPTVTFSGLAASYCGTPASITLTGNHAPAGSFTGAGITDNGNGTATFNPATAGAGAHNIVYSYTDGNTCVNTNTQSVTIIAPTTYYADADGDGFGNPAVTEQTCSGPSVGFVANSLDCDDANIHYADADGDGFGSTTMIACGGVLNNTDCDDAVLHYADVDGDGFGSDTLVNCGGVLNSDDCDDTALQYLDADGDGFGSTTQVACGVTNNTDCDDNAIQYLDFDGDGFGSNTQVACGVLNNTDCNDNNNAMHATFPFYADADGDTYGAGSLVSVCAVDALTPPAGYSLSNTDCDDANSAIYQNGTFYVDADGDGYSSGATQVVCYGASTPAGYLASPTAIDCNDNVFAINPGHAEVLYNGVDDNCDGNQDEGNLLTTSLLSTSCNATLTSIGSLIQITTVAGHPITGYRIRATNGAEVQIIEKNVPHFTMPQFGSYAYATTYTIEIQLQRAGVWLGYYGPACQVSTPAVLAEGGAASISPSQCGITLTKINTVIATTSLQGVTGYRFKITNLTDQFGPNAVQTLDRVQNWFTLQMLTRYNYGTNYRIEVAVKSTGGYGGFGSPCEINSPAVPTLVNCGATIAAGTTLVATSSLAGATQYRFQIVRQLDNASSTIDRSTHYFTFNMVPSAIFTAGGVYSVRVALMTTGTWSPFGDACEITAPGGSPAKGIMTTTAAEPETAFKATVYPNPFTADFSIDVTTSSKENVQLKVYDMLGKLIESREIKADELNMEKVGTQYPSGVYNVIVSQDGIVKTLRVIKR